MSNEFMAQQTIAKMLHNAELVTWTIRTIGKAIALFTLPVLLGAVIAGVSGDPSWYVVGSVVALTFGLIHLTNAHAPSPSARLIELVTHGEVGEAGDDFGTVRDGANAPRETS